MKKTYKIEINALKSEIASPSEDASPIKKGVWGSAIDVWKSIKTFFEKTRSEKTTFYIRIALGVVAVGLIVWGICNGGMQDVLEKAITICKQCIGIG